MLLRIGILADDFRDPAQLILGELNPTRLCVFFRLARISRADQSVGHAWLMDCPSDGQLGNGTIPFLADRLQFFQHIGDALTIFFAEAGIAIALIGFGELPGRAGLPSQKAPAEGGISQEGNAVLLAVGQSVGCLQATNIRWSTPCFSKNHRGLGETKRHAQYGRRL